MALIFTFCLCDRTGHSIIHGRTSAGYWMKLPVKNMLEAFVGNCGAVLARTGMIRFSRMPDLPRTFVPRTCIIVELRSLLSEERTLM
ncbi:hypothetical protein ASPTUDRAFT_264663 [Aspergillus tubingensis CBS 134.48]|uniref:Uncharacterized protein n=1 Tax=Aspergillus tubingensis (strain CBS 134.48) TaxID=767770 RepID=A0A1L9NN91_ASPTC|nr:hypothetical protein ASPTUDRAFT_264663 [Aspergillus tubingensis CBS 134.48]